MGKEWAGLFFPGERTDWGEIPACYTGSQLTKVNIEGIIYNLLVCEYADLIMCGSKKDSELASQ